MRRKATFDGRATIATGGKSQGQDLFQDGNARMDGCLEHTCSMSLERAPGAVGHLWVNEWRPRPESTDRSFGPVMPLR